MKQKITKVALVSILTATIVLGIYARSTPTKPSKFVIDEPCTETAGPYANGQSTGTSLVDCLTCTISDAPPIRILIEGEWYDVYHQTEGASTATVNGCRTNTVWETGVCQPISKNPLYPTECPPIIIRAVPNTGTGTGSNYRGGTIL